MNLKKVREQKGLSQTELANIFGVVRSTICQYEKGTRQPDITMLKRYSHFFNVSVDYLLCDDIWTVGDYANDVIDTKKIGSTPTDILTAEERELVELYRSFSPLFKNTTLETMRTWAGMKSSQIDLHKKV